MIKKVVISAAGQGTRMQDLTKDKSKHLIQVQDKPFLAYLLDNIYTAGYREIILVVGFKSDLMEQFAKGYMADKSDLHINLVSQFEILGPKEKEYGTACPIKCVRDLVGNKQFISLCGDNFYSVDDLQAMNVDDEYIYVAGLENEHPERYGVLKENNGFLESIVEKPSEPVGNLINTSLYKFTPDIFEKVFNLEKSPRGEYEITDAINLLAKENKVKVKKMKDFWMDFGRPEDIEKFSNFIQSESSFGNS